MEVSNSTYKNGMNGMCGVMTHDFRRNFAGTIVDFFLLKEKNQLPGISSMTVIAVVVTAAAAAATDATVDVGEGIFVCFAYKYVLLCVYVWVVVDFFFA